MISVHKKIAFLFKSLYTENMGRNFKKHFEKNRQATLLEQDSKPVVVTCLWTNGCAEPVDRKIRQSFYIKNVPPSVHLKEGDVVDIEVPRSVRPNQAGVFRRLICNMNDAFASTMISMAEAHLPEKFSEDAEKEAEKAIVPDITKTRKDLRAIPFVTIDGADAKDFDDAVWAEKDKSGWHIMVGIADVSWYVRPDSMLDKEAFRRGNSTYFPDRVVPMLPFSLSNGVCSLNPNEPRGALVCEVWLDENGKKKRHKFYRALIQSVARLTYDEVQDVIEGTKKLDVDLDALISVYKLLEKQRTHRGTLELDVPERQVVLDKKGRVKEVHLREQNDAMKLIEELMILANVSAAETLTELGQGTLYRVHDHPSNEKIETLNAYLKTLNKKPLSTSALPRDFNAVLKSMNLGKQNYVLNNLILRTQAQAVYSPDNIGHFGLALEKYTHFTAPIRRYSDLLVHRLLVSGLKLGEGGITLEQTKNMERLAEHISFTERQSAAAEQNAVDRYLASSMQDKIGQAFTGRISSVTAFGLFIMVDGTEADGFVPFRAMNGDYFRFDEKRTCLIGKHSGKTYQLGDSVSVILCECTPATGGLVFKLANPNKKLTKYGL